MDDRIDNSDFIVNAGDRNSVIEYEQNRICTDTARKFRECRAAEGITQAELGKLAGVSQPNITRFESGNYNPSLEFLVKIAAAMNRKVSISIDDCSDRQAKESLTHFHVNDKIFISKGR